jgi:cell wall-associated NlpC family hydrolase
MSISNYQLVSFCELALQKPTLYMWGTYGKPITTSLLSSKIKQYPKNYSEARQKYIKSKIDGKTIGCDCAGLIKWALWTNCDINAPIKYNSKTDRGTAGLYSAAKEKGKIATLPEQPGVIVYKNGHVGVYIGNGKVIECTLGKRGDGIVKTDLNAAGWTHWLKLPEVEYVPDHISIYQKKTSILDKLAFWRRDR